MVAGAPKRKKAEDMLSVLIREGCMKTLYLLIGCWSVMCGAVNDSFLYSL